MKNFTQGNILKSLFLFSLPIMGANFLQIVYIVIDAVWVGRLLGSGALAAVSATFPVIFFMFSFMVGLGIATNILVAQCYGAGDKERLKNILSNSFLLTVFLCGAISLLGVIFSKKIIKFMNIPDDIFSSSYIYFVVILWGMLGRAIYNWFVGVLRGLGDSKTPLKLLLLSVIFNIIITPLLIKGFAFLPPLGVAGSAIGTTLASFLAIALGYIYFIKKDYRDYIKGWNFALDNQTIKKILNIGLPSSLQMIVRSLSWIIIASLVNNFGEKIIAAYGVGVRIDMFVFLPILSIGMAASTMIAQNFGANSYKRISSIIKYSTYFSLFFSTIFFFLVNFHPDFFIRLFTPDFSVFQNTKNYLKIISFSYFAFAFIFSYQAFIKGSGETKYIFIFSLISMFMVRVPFAYLLSFSSLRERGIWFAIVISSFVSMFLALYYYQRNKKINTKSLGLSSSGDYNFLSLKRTNALSGV